MTRGPERSSKAAVVLNALNAGKWPCAAARVEGRAGAPEVLVTERAGDGVRLARDLAEAGFDPVLAAGGDGTLNEVVNGVLLASRTPVVGFVPLGSGNDFLRTLGAEASERELDAVRLRCQPGVDRYFVNVASAGLGAATARLGGRLPKVLPARLRYLAATLPALTRRRAARVRLSLDGAPFADCAMTTLALANGRFQGGGIHIAPDARLDDGRMNVTLVEPVGLLDLLLNTRLLYSGAIYTHPKVRHWSAARVRVESDAPVPVEMDGEVVGHLPLEAEVLPRRLRMTAY